MTKQFHFTHRLTRDASYRALLGTNRRMLHTAAADTLAARHVAGAPGEQELLGAVAQHLLAGGESRRAHDWLCLLLDLLISGGRTQNCAGLLEQATACWNTARAVDPALPALSAQLLLVQGNLARCQRDYAAAEEQLQQALALARAAGDRKLAAQALAGRTAVEKDQGRLEEAQRHSEAALAELHAAGLQSQAGPILNSLASLHFNRGRPEAAAQCLQQALALARAQGNLRLTGIIEGNLGVLHLEAKDFEAARASYEAEYEAARAIGNLRSECWALAHLGGLDDTIGDHLLARDYFERAYQLSRELGDPMLSSWVEDLLACILMDHLGELEQARELINRMLAAACQRNDERITGSALTTLGRLEWKRGNPATAREHFADARQLLQATGDTYLLGLLLKRWHAAESDTASGGDPQQAAELSAVLAALEAEAD